MPQARAAVRQTGGRTPLGLVLPGKTVLIVVGEIREPNPNFMVQEAITRAMKERGVNAVIVPTWDLLGVTEQEYLASTRGSAHLYDQRRPARARIFLHRHRPDAERRRRAANGSQQKDPELYAATWPEPKIADQRALRRSWPRNTPRACRRR